MFKLFAILFLSVGLCQGRGQGRGNFTPGNLLGQLGLDVTRKDQPEAGTETQIPQANVLLPNPNGPFYGFPYDVATTWGRKLPFTVAGKCEPGKIYSIKKPEDIFNYDKELECVYNTGVAPAKTPEGPLYGTVISALNTRLFNQFVGQFWKGKLINKTQCNGNTAFLGWNNFMGNPSAPFGAYVGQPGLNLAPGEYDNGRSAVVLEYGVDLSEACPEYKDYVLQNFGRAALRGISASAAAFPSNQMVETFRFVGKQGDGGDIYLGKSYMKDAYREDKQAATIAYFILINYDKDANPVAIAGLPTLPSQGFKYMLPGIVDLALRVNPIDNLLTAPVRTINKFIRGLVKTGTNSLLFAQTLPFGMQTLRRNSQIFQKRFHHEVQNQVRQPTTPTSKPVPKGPPGTKGRDDLEVPTTVSAVTPAEIKTSPFAPQKPQSVVVTSTPKH